MACHKYIERDGKIWDVTPAPGNTYTRETWPPRGRGRGESLSSPRRIAAKFRATAVIRMRMGGATWTSIAAALGYRDHSGAYRAWKRTLDRLNWDDQRREETREDRATARRAAKCRYPVCWPQDGTVCYACLPKRARH
jgi:hypothetical protein